jgi:hypothetical protein
VRKARINVALVLLASAIVFNFVILVRGEESAGWPIAAIVLLGTAGVSLLAERRGPG